MNIKSRDISIIYLFLYFSLLLGFYFNEDFAGGYLIDYLAHKRVVGYFDANFIESLLNYEEFDHKIPRSPIFITFFFNFRKNIF